MDSLPLFLQRCFARGNLQDKLLYEVIDGVVHMKCTIKRKDALIDNSDPVTNPFIYLKGMSQFYKLKEEQWRYFLTLESYPLTTLKRVCVAKEVRDGEEWVIKHHIPLDAPKPNKCVADITYEDRDYSTVVYILNFKISPEFISEYPLLISSIMTYLSKHSNLETLQETIARSYDSSEAKAGCECRNFSTR